MSMETAFLAWLVAALVLVLGMRLDWSIGPWKFSNAHVMIWVMWPVALVLGAFLAVAYVASSLWNWSPRRPDPVAHEVVELGEGAFHR